MSEEEGKRTRIVRAEYFKTALPVEEPPPDLSPLERLVWESQRDRAERLGIIRRKIGAAEKAVTEEAVIVTLAEKRSRWKGDQKIEWQDLYTKDHLHRPVQAFKDLIDRKKAAGYAITTKDAVEAYLLVFGHARKSEIAGFLWALRKDYPEFTTKHRPETRPVMVPQLFGPPKEEEKIFRVPVTITSPDELINTVGQALSRLKSEGVVGSAEV
jgi:hypothetical protein